MSKTHSRAALRLSSAVLVALLASACASPLSYQPNANLVTELGTDTTKTRLKETVMRAKESGGGHVVGVEVTDEALKVQSQQTTPGVFWIPETRHLQTRCGSRQWSASTSSRTTGPSSTPAATVRC